MKYIGTSLKRNKKYLKIISFFLLLGFFIGFILYHKLDNIIVLEQTKNIATYLNENKINFILYHIMILSILFILSCLGIGIFLFPLYLTYEGISISYQIFTFTKVFKLKGFIYSLLYNLLAKGMFIILFLLIWNNMFQMVKTIIPNLKNKRFQDDNSNIIMYIKKTIIYFVLVLINDILIYLFLNNILSKLLFIII